MVKNISGEGTFRKEKNYLIYDNNIKYWCQQKIEKSFLRQFIYAFLLPNLASRHVDLGVQTI